MTEDVTDGPVSKVDLSADRHDGVGAKLTVVIAFVGMFVTVLDSNAVNVALPTIGRQLSAGVVGLQWVVDAYLLMFAALMLSAGTVSDRVGANRTLTGGLAVFTVTSAACALAPNIAFLVAARVAQGGAAALMLPASLSLVHQAFEDPAARAKGIAVWSMGGGAAITSGPVIGGILTSTFGWRAIFLVNVPICVAGMFGAARARSTRPAPARLDFPGQVCAGLAVAALTFAIIQGGSARFSPLVIGALVIFAAALVAFLAIEGRTRHPAVPLSLFRAPGFAVCTIAGFSLNFAFYGILFMLTLYFQNTRGATALETGLMFLPLTALIVVMNMVAGRLAARYGPKLPLVLGQVIQAAGLLGLLTITPDTPTIRLLALLIPHGVGGALALPALASAGLERVDARRSGVASGILNVARQVGSALGVAGFGALIGMTTGFMTALWLSLAIGAAIQLATAAGCLFLLRRGTPERAESAQA